MLNQVEDYTHLVGGQWTVDKKLNKLVQSLLHNYKNQRKRSSRYVEKRKVYYLCR